MCTCIRLLTCGILNSGADIGEVALTGVETVFSFDSDDVAVADSNDVAIAELDGGDLVEAGLPDSITNLSYNAYIHIIMYKSTMKVLT